MCNFESFQEFLENLILCLLSGEYIWVLIGFVDTSNIIDINPAISILVKGFESLSYNLLSCHVHWSSHCSDELIIRDGSTGVHIKV